MKGLHRFFTTQLLLWFATHERPLPWKGEKNPYLIWLSEIILQQTRVEQGLAYFERFRQKYPTIKDLADAPEDEIMKQWEGLGYYARARNLHFTAKHIAYNLNGVFPTTYPNILALKGVGTYTAAAIASFAYDLPYAVVDGNVYRVLARFFGILEAIDTTIGKKQFQELAQTLLAKQEAANYNQAIMDFGATVCMPKNPICEQCPLQKKCTAFKDNSIALLPFKSKKIKKTNRFFNFLIINLADTVLIEKRVAKDIWKNLYQFPLIESNAVIEKGDLEKTLAWQELFAKGTMQLKSVSQVFKQNLTHQKIHSRFWEIEVNLNFDAKNKDFITVKRENLNKFAFPKTIDCYLQDNSLFLF